MWMGVMMLKNADAGLAEDLDGDRRRQLRTLHLTATGKTKRNYRLRNRRRKPNHHTLTDGEE
jgi:hypothetical protein